MIDGFTLEALKVGGLPLVIGVAGLLAARAVCSERRALVLGVTVVIACLAVHTAVAGWPKLPPRQSLDVLPLLLAGALLLVAARGRSATIILALPVAAACAWFLVSRLRGMTSADQVLWSAATSAVLFLLWWPALAETTRATVIPGVLAVVAGGAAGAALFSHSAKLAEITGGLAVCLGLVACVTLWRPCALAARGASLAGGVALGGLLVFDQHFLEELTAPEVALLSLGWATLHVGRAPFARRWTERRAMVLHALLALLPVLAALAMGWPRYKAGLDNNPYY